MNQEDNSPDTMLNSDISPLNTRKTRRPWIRQLIVKPKLFNHVLPSSINNSPANTPHFTIHGNSVNKSGGSNQSTFGYLQPSTTTNTSTIVPQLHLGTQSQQGHRKAYTSFDNAFSSPFQPLQTTTYEPLPDPVIPDTRKLARPQKLKRRSILFKDGAGADNFYHNQR